MAKKEIIGRLLRVTGGDWLDDHLAVSPNARATVECEVEIEGSIQVVNATWKKLPEWLRQAILGPHPLCPCGRRRMSMSENADGYTRCAFCRNEEQCDVCGKQTVRIVLRGDRRICPACLPKQRAVETATVSEETLSDLLEQVGRLLKATALEGFAGESLASAVLPHLPASSTAGWAWYYIVDRTVYASHLSPAALELLSHLPKASSEGRHLFLSWVSGGPFRGGQDYFTQTQVLGKVIPLPSIQAGQLRLAACLGTF